MVRAVSRVILSLDRLAATLHRGRDQRGGASTLTISSSAIDELTGVPLSSPATASGTRAQSRSFCTDERQVTLKETVPGRRRESHPPPPTDPDVNLSAHPARAVQSSVLSTAAPSVRTGQVPVSGLLTASPALVSRCVRAACTSASPTASNGDRCVCRQGSPRSDRTR